MLSHDEAMPYSAGMGLAWRGSELRRGYKSDPNTEGAPDLRDRPATPPRFQPPIHPKLGGNIAAIEAQTMMENETVHKSDKNDCAGTRKMKVDKTEDEMTVH